MRYVMVLSAFVLLLGFSSTLLASRSQQDSMKSPQPMVLAHGLEEDLEKCMVLDHTGNYTSYRCSGRTSDQNSMLMLLTREGRFNLNKIEKLYEASIEAANDFLQDIGFKHYNLSKKIKRVKVTPLSVEVEFYPLD